MVLPDRNLERPGDAAAAARLAESVADLRARDYPVEWTGPQRARELAPDLRPPNTDIAFHPTEGHVHPALLVARLWGEARDHGAELRRTEPTAVTESRGEVHLELGDGAHETREAGVAAVAVIATGRWTEALTATAGHRVAPADPEVPGSAAVGLLAGTAPLATRLNLVRTTPGLNVRPDGGGRLVLQAPDLDARTHRPRTARTQRSSAAASTRCSPEPAAPTWSSSASASAMPADGRTAAGFLDEHVYALATHSGITLGPLLGRLAAHEVVTGQPVEQLTDFRPQRLLRADRPPQHPARHSEHQ